MEIEAIVLTTDIGRVWNADKRTVETALRKKNIPIISLSPNKRGISQEHYRLLLENRTGEIGGSK
jgi:hypothetical protein